MKNEKKFYQAIGGVTVVTALILLIPLIAGQFTDSVDWSPGDFMLAGALLFGTGLSYAFATMAAPNILYRAAMGLALGGALFMIWANFAVGLIGGGPNPGNLLYAGVVMVIVIGILRARLEAKGMEDAMYATALALVFVAAIALLTGMDRYPGSSMVEILGVNAFLATPFLLAAMLFRRVAREQSPANNEPT